MRGIGRAFGNGISGMLGLAFAVTLFIRVVEFVAIIALAVLLVVLVVRLVQVATARRRVATVQARIAHQTALRDVERAHPWLVDPTVPRPSQRRSQGQQGWSQAEVSDRR